MEVTSCFFAIQSCWKLLHSRAVRGSARSTTGLFPVSCPWTEVDTYQLQNKQMRSTGVLTEREASTEVLQEPLATRSLRMYLDTDDSASAQIKAWQLHCGKCEDNLHARSSRSPCWKHQYHLDRNDAYVRAGQLLRRLFHSVGGFFATLSKWMNLWRCFFRQDLQVMGLRERSRQPSQKKQSDVVQENSREMPYRKVWVSRSLHGPRSRRRPEFLLYA